MVKCERIWEEDKGWAQAANETSRERALSRGGAGQETREYVTAERERHVGRMMAMRPEGQHEEGAPVRAVRSYFIILRKKDTFMRKIARVAMKMDCMRGDGWQEAISTALTGDNQFWN